MKIEIRYAQGKGGQRLHIVPVLSGDVLNTALCGRHVDHWRMTINVPLAHCCRNCMRVNRRRGRQRAKELLISALLNEGA